MIRETLTVMNKLGLHARAAGTLVQLSNTFRSEITVSRDGTRVNAKSILGLMMLAAHQGTELEVDVEGVDEEKAFAAIEDLFRKKFNEE